MPNVGDDDRTVPVPGKARSTDVSVGPPPDGETTVPVPGREGAYASSSPSDPAFDPSVSYTEGLRSPEERFPTIPEAGQSLYPPSPSTLPGGADGGDAASARGAEPVVGPATWGVSGSAPSSTPTAPGSKPPRIVLVGRDGTEGESFPMHGPQFTIGRSQGDVTFPDDAFMSPAHARLERSGTSFSLVDLGSRNGLYLRIRGTAAVYPGDLFMIGHQVLRLENIGDGVQEAPPDADGTGAFGTPLAPAWGKLVLVGRGGVAGDQYYLRASSVLLGREAGDIVFPDDPYVSREHARLRLEIETSSMAVYLEDLESANGTYMRIRGGAQVRALDTFRVGDQILRLRLDG
jgi:pSer/pThr/pTyr-binding forkhead associated (FHA) protein